MRGKGLDKLHALVDGLFNCLDGELCLKRRRGPPRGLAPELAPATRS